MKKILILVGIVISLFAFENKTVSDAKEAGELTAEAVLITNPSSIEKAAKLCESVVSSSSLMGVKNRNELMPYAIQSCKDFTKRKMQ